jgi:amino acid permease
MILYMWPIILVLVFPVICATAELASAYPVAGAMSSWTWIMAKRGVGGERYWGWLMGGIVLGYHVTTVSYKAGGFVWG